MRLLVLCCFAFTSCLTLGCTALGPSIVGSGTITKVTRETGEFSKVSFAGSGQLTLAVGGDSATCEVECDDNLQEYVETIVNDDSLTIRFKNNVNLRPSKSIQITVSLPKLKGLELAGSSTTTISGLAESESLELDAAGSHEINCTGNLDKLNTKIAGSCKLLARELVVRDIQLEIAGSCSAQVHATENLKVKVAGSGSVKYLGDPKISQSIAGVGRVEKLTP